MSASKVLDLAEKQGLLEPKVIADLRRQVAESKFIVTPEAIVKVLVDREHLTPFQARKLVSSALGELPPEPEPPKPEPPKPEPAKRPKSGPSIPDELTLVDEEPGAGGPRAAGFAPAAPADDDVVLLEAVPAPTPVRSEPPRPVSSPPKVQPPKLDAPKRESSGHAVTRALDEELVDLEPVPPAPSPASSKQIPKAPSWKKDHRFASPSAAPPADDLVPLEPITLTPLPPQHRSGVAAQIASPPAPPPLLDLMSADPLAGPHDPLASPPPHGPPQTKPKKTRKNVWDSPLLLIGGGSLGVIVVAFVLLYLQLTRGTAAELLAAADEEYRNGSYTNAMAAYEQFLSSYSSDEKASFARVRLGMAQLRQVSDEGRNPRQGLTTAKVILPQIEKEEKFSEARLELSTLLPDIADGFATLATQAEDIAEKEKLVAQADEAMQLVNTPAYLPASLRKEREGRIAGILDKLKVAQRSIQQNKDLAVALGKIDAAEQKGDAAAAYQVRGDLLKVYPALVASPELVAAIRKVGDKERELVKVSSEALAAATDDPLGATTQIVLAYREGPEPAATATQVVFVSVEGAVYGIDAASGRVLWRRHVGYETLVQPQPIAPSDGADALVADARDHSLLRLSAATGKVVWRQSIGHSFTAPLVIGERIIVATTAGRVLQINAASGEVMTAAQLPQSLPIAPAFDARQSRLVQLGEHSTLFVLSGETLECSDTYYLGHARGSILVPPVALLDLVLAAESPADDHTLIHVLSPTGENKRLVELGQPFRLKGRVTQPLAVAGRRVAAVTDLGQVAVYEIDPANKQSPVRLVGELEASEQVASQIYSTAAPNRLWVASRRCSLLEIQGSLQTLSRKWSRYQDDVFIGPLQAIGDVLVHVRRRPGGAAAIVEGCQADGGQTVWSTHLAAPVAALLPATTRSAVDAVTLEGRVLSLTAEVRSGGGVGAPAFPLPPGSVGSILPEVATASPGSQSIWTQTQAGGLVLAYDPATGSAPATLPPAEATDRAAAAAVIWGSNVLVPRTSGKVELLSLATGNPASLPFLPTLKPDELPQWSRPAVLSDGSGFVISDGRQMLYRVALKPQPQPHLAAAAEQAVEVPIRGALATVGDTIYGLAHGETGDTLVALDPQTLAQMAKWPLNGRASFGPSVAHGSAFVFSEADGLLCLEAGQKLRWQRPLERGPLAGPPLAAAPGELLLLYQNGVLARVAADTGDEIAAQDLGQPLGRAACLDGSNILVSTADGSLIVAPSP